jgi:hypothetical protein
VVSGAGRAVERPHRPRNGPSRLRYIAVSSPSLDRRVVLLLAVACGASVANLHYAQPLLDVIARDLGVSSGAAGLLVTCWTAAAWWRGCSW